MCVLHILHICYRFHVSVHIVTECILFMCRVKADLDGSKEMYVIGKGFQYVIDSNFRHDLHIIATIEKFIKASCLSVCTLLPRYLRTSGWPNMLPLQLNTIRRALKRS